MKTFLLSCLGSFVALILFIGLVTLGLIAAIGGGEPKQPSAIVLEIDLRDEISDQPATQGLGVVFQDSSFLDILAKLDAAATDPHVKGVYIRASEFGVGSARAEELRAAFLKLRANGKFVVAHSQGMIGAGPSSLRSIAAADEIWLQPGSDILVNGISFETLFMKDLFDNLSIKAEIEQFYEYKNAPNVYKETDYTASHREAMTELASDVWNISLQDIAEDRGFDSVEALKALLEAGPISPDEAVQTGLFDGLKWPEDASEAALKRGGDNAVMLTIAEYVAPPAPKHAPVIAVVGGEGPIITGRGGDDLFGDEAFGSDRVAEALLEAGRNPDVQAIVFRVDSPGGSATASEQIWRAVQRVQDDMGKPVIVSMGSVAASGGYYVSAGADAILASRTTITGSIGVFGGKFAIADGLRRIGINPSTITVGGEFADAFSTEVFTDTQREQLRESLGRTYDRFMFIVSEGRELPESRVREIAKGRVWSGIDALELKLVTQNGGYIDAIAKAKELANIAPDTKVQVVFYPQPEGLFADFGSSFGHSAQARENAALMNEVMSDERFQLILRQGLAVRDGQTQMSAPLIIEH